MDNEKTLEELIAEVEEIHATIMATYDRVEEYLERENYDG